jgi:hypothetical protein
VHAWIWHEAPCLCTCYHSWCALVPPVQFSIAYRLGHDIVSNKVGSFKTQDIFRAETFFNISADTGSGTPSAVRSKRLAKSTCLRSGVDAPPHAC